MYCPAWSVLSRYVYCLCCCVKTCKATVKACFSTTPKHIPSLRRLRSPPPVEIRALSGIIASRINQDTEGPCKLLTATELQPNTTMAMMARIPYMSDSVGCRLPVHRPGCSQCCTCSPQSMARQDFGRLLTAKYRLEGPTTECTRPQSHLGKTQHGQRAKHAAAAPARIWSNLPYSMHPMTS